MRTSSPPSTTTRQVRSRFPSAPPQCVRSGLVAWIAVPDSCRETGADARRKVAPDVANGYAHSFTFKDLLVATGYFNEANFIGEGGFGKVYKGKINGQVRKNLFF